MINAQDTSDRLFDGTTRWSARLVLAIALATIVAPMFSLDPAVMGRSDWSAFDILASVYAGRLSPAAALFNSTMLCLWLSYVMMLVGLVALWLPHYGKPLALAAIVGLYASGQFVVHGHYDLKWLLSATSWGGQEGLVVAYQPTLYLLPILFVLLLLLVSGKFRRS